MVRGFVNPFIDGIYWCSAYVFWITMSYLTTVWKLSITHAAAILNIVDGTVAILPIGIKLLANTVIPSPWIFLFSYIACSLGLGLLSLSTPSVSYKVAGTCNQYRVECIGGVQKTLFYSGLILTTFGVSGSIATMIEERGEDDKTFGLLKKFISSKWKLLKAKGRHFIVGDGLSCGCKCIILELLYCCYICCLTFGFIMLSIFLLPSLWIVVPFFVKTWSLKFGIVTVYIVFWAIVWAIAMWHSEATSTIKPKGTTLETAIRVFVASTSKMFQKLPDDHNQLYVKETWGFVTQLKHTDGLRCLDKAAIILSTQTLAQQEQNKWKLCTVHEVEETKILIRMIPIWMTFIVCGVVSSVGNTYFMEQAGNMDPHLGTIKVPTIIFFCIYKLVEILFHYIFGKFYKGAWLGGEGEWLSRRKQIIGIGISMLFSILCCVTAAKVEARRLDMIKSHKSDDPMPMSMFYLLPQFVLLGVVDGVYKKSTFAFLESKTPESMQDHGRYFANGVLGLGIIGSVLSAYIAARVSEREGKLSWFQDTLDESRLDNYYWTLACLCAINLFFYLVIVSCYKYAKPSSSGDGEETNLQRDNFEFCDSCLHF